MSLTENKAQLQRWMVAHPEVATVINEFESVQRTNKAKDQLYDTMGRTRVSCCNATGKMVYLDSYLKSIPILFLYGALHTNCS